MIDKNTFTEFTKLNRVTFLYYVTVCRRRVKESQHKW